MKRAATRLRGLLLGATCLLGAVAATEQAALAAPPEASGYPILDEKQLGQLNYIIQIASQADGDFSNMLLLPGMKGADEHVRVQLAFMNYALGAAVYNYTPAYRELGEQASSNMLRKMIDYSAWGDIVRVSQGVAKFNPPEILPLPTSYDPTAHFIMYSGHLFQMLAAHQMLFNDNRFSKPNSIRFQYPPTFNYPAEWTVTAGKAFTYDLGSLTKRIYGDFEHYGWRGDACLPGAVFVLCNQQPMLGFKMYDHLYGTKYFTTASTQYKKVLAEENALDPKTKTWANFYSIHTKKWVQEPMGAVDGWAGAFMHAWDKAAIEAVYPTQRDYHIVTLPDGTATVKGDLEKELKSPHPVYSEDQGFMAVLAAEVGDAATKAKMLNYADKYYAPRWNGDAYYYPIAAEFRRADDAPNVWRRVQPLQSTSTFALARLLPKDGLYKMYNHPFTAKHFQQPYVSNITYPDVQVPRAVFDETKNALVVTLRPGRTASTTAVRSWTFNNLDPKGSWAVWQDGRKLATLQAGAVKPAAGVTGLEMQGATTLKVSMPVAKETTFIVEGEKAGMPALKETAFMIENDGKVLAKGTDGRR